MLSAATTTETETRECAPEAVLTTETRECAPEAVLSATTTETETRECAPVSVLITAESTTRDSLQEPVLLELREATLPPGLHARRCADIRLRIRDGEALWLPPFAERSLSAQIRDLGGFWDKGHPEDGVQPGWIFQTVRGRELAEALLHRHREQVAAKRRQLQLPHVPLPGPCAPGDCLPMEESARLFAALHQQLTGGARQPAGGAHV